MLKIRTGSGPSMIVWAAAGASMVRCCSHTSRPSNPASPMAASHGTSEVIGSRSACTVPQRLGSIATVPSRIVAAGARGGREVPVESGSFWSGMATSRWAEVANYGDSLTSATGTVERDGE